MTRCYFSLFFLVILGDFSADVQLSNKQISIYDQLEMKVTLSHPSTFHPEINTIRGNLLQHHALTEPPFTLVSSEVEEESGKTVLTFTLEPQTAGKHTLSLYEIPFISEDGEKMELISDLFRINVSLPDRDPKFNIKPLLSSLNTEYPIEIDSVNRTFLTADMDAIKHSNLSIYHSKTLPWVMIIGAIVLSLLYLIARQQPKHIPLKRESETVRKTLVQKVALQQLKAINTTNTADAYYVELTNTVRNYIEKCYQLPASTKTTEEFLNSMNTYPIFDQEGKELLSQFLIHSDRVKFAEEDPSLSEREEALLSAENFIKTIYSIPKMR